ncbi:MAG: hypothetical protein AB4368_31150 [Xenococcaceae cyanobacterium]
MSSKKLFENGTDFYIPWSNQTGKTISVAIVNEQNIITKKLEITPGENIVVPPKNILRIIS